MEKHTQERPAASVKKLYPKAKCPYCGTEQYLSYEGVEPLDDIYFVEKMEQDIITDSFSEIETHQTCQYCGKIFHFVHNIRESMQNRRGTTFASLDKREG